MKSSLGSVPTENTESLSINSKESFQQLLSAKTCIAFEMVLPFGLRPRSSQPRSCNAGRHLEPLTAMLKLEISVESEQNFIEPNKALD